MNIRQRSRPQVAPAGGGAAAGGAAAGGAAAGGAAGDGAAVGGAASGGDAGGGAAAGGAKRPRPLRPGQQSRPGAVRARAALVSKSVGPSAKAAKQVPRARGHSIVRYIMIVCYSLAHYIIL